MSKFKFDLRNHEFDFECPGCGKEFTFKGKDINHEVTCPKCKSTIFLDGKQFDKQIKDIEKQLNNLFG